MEKLEGYHHDAFVLPNPRWSSVRIALQRQANTGGPVVGRAIGGAVSNCAMPLKGNPPKMTLGHNGSPDIAGQGTSKIRSLLCMQ